MANNKMLIDASHREETRVAVVRGNRIEEFDFESLAKKQLRGNIYLAKVTRVEPSLQAAFVDYGGNRHGFLAFSEIHPDYYQIPTADRQALLEEEAREAGEEAEEEERQAEKPKRGRRSTRGRKKAAAEDAETAAENGENGEPEAGEEPDDSEEDTPAGSIAAIVETDSISEPAPEADADGDEEERAPAEAQDGDADAQAETEAKPRRRTSRRKSPAKAKKPAKSDEDDSEKPAKAAEADEPAEAGDTEAESSETNGGDDDGDEAPAGRKRGRSTRGRRGRKSGTSDSADDEEEESVESVGREDALEEVPTRRKPRRQYKIQEVIKRRQVMLVQVVKEERGNKGAALTTYLSLAGRYSVLMPNTARGGGISRKITNAADRKRLKAIASELDVPAGMGVILRTAGASRTKAEIKRDFEYLMRLWETVRSLTLSSNAPCLVYEEGSLIKRSIRDLYDKNIGEVLVSGDEGYREAKDFMRMLMPSHAKNVKPYAEDQALFSRFSVEQQLERLLSAQVTLKSGGYLVINQTEALVSIDVNSGRSTREHSIEDTALQTNLEAADEIARQLRLRDLAGLIVIDFIDMEEKRNNRAVEKRLKDALKNDRARIQVGRISHFGLMEMSRQRIRASVMESTMEVCPHCQGAGHVRSDTSIALHVFRAIEDHAMRHSSHDVVVRCPTRIALDILNSKRGGLSEIEERFGLHVRIEADPTLPGQSFAIDKGEPATGVPSRPAPAAGDGASADDEELDDAVASDEAEEAVSGRADDNGSEDDESGRRKRRRRRGKRGGRRNRAEDAAAGEEESGDGDTDDAGIVEEASAGDGEPADDRAGKEKAEEEPSTRRRGRRGRRSARSEEAEDAATDKPDQGKAEAADAVAEKAGSTAAKLSGDDDEPAQGSGSESAAKKTDDTEAATTRRNRNTRRPRDTGKSAPEAGEEAEPLVGAEASAGESDDPGDKPAPKRKGWWNRGGGFF